MGNSCYCLHFSKVHIKLDRSFSIWHRTSKRTQKTFLPGRFNRQRLFTSGGAVWSYQLDAWAYRTALTNSTDKQIWRASNPPQWSTYKNDETKFCAVSVIVWYKGALEKGITKRQSNIKSIVHNSYTSPHAASRWLRGKAGSFPRTPTRPSAAWRLCWTSLFFKMPCCTLLFFFFFWWGLLHGPQQGPDRMKEKTYKTGKRKTPA